MARIVLEIGGLSFLRKAPHSTIFGDALPNLQNNQISTDLSLCDFRHMPMMSENDCLPPYSDLASACRQEVARGV
jgi:hypothetical protein